MRFQGLDRRHRHRADVVDAPLQGLLSAHEANAGAAMIVVAPLSTAFGVVEIEDDDRVTGFQDSPSSRSGRMRV